MDVVPAPAVLAALATAPKKAEAATAWAAQGDTEALAQRDADCLVREA